MKKYILLVIGVNFWLMNNAQICGTYVDNDQKTLEATISVNPGTATQSISQLNKDLSIGVYIVNDNTYAPGITQTRIQSLIDTLNILFSTISLKFHVCFYNTVANYQYNELSNSNENDLTFNNHSTDIINLYFVGTIRDALGNEVPGYTYFPASNKDYIFLRKVASYRDLAHQIGHFFGVYHTHETGVAGAELVARTSCATTGDKCCDTEADPNVLGRVGANCNYTGLLKDANGAYYNPSVKNIMSFGNTCISYLTKTQYLRIIYSINNQKKNLH